MTYFIGKLRVYEFEDLQFAVYFGKNSDVKQNGFNHFYYNVVLYT